MFKENMTREGDMTLVSNTKKTKLLRVIPLIFTLFCAVAVGVCLIVDAANNPVPTWSWYVTYAVAYFWIITLPLLIAKKQKKIFSLATLSVATIPFLYLIDLLTPARSWFLIIGLPTAVTLILGLWGAVALIRFLKINRWYLRGGITVGFGIIIVSVVLYSVGVYRNRVLDPIITVASIFVLVIISLLIIILGYILSNNDAPEEVPPIG